ncbi:uncharacterized protein LOC129741632 [Uranotaenia lowii]|uniref:uncharacterized protein LOC129741632 n=1 Tax=Uranotaenia lowii TaxID=190385 RepID=UPI00247A3859|nr:uncharacterized protein LOC129741632 [Uranotaenia lowii]
MFCKSLSLAFVTVAFFGSAHGATQCDDGKRMGCADCSSFQICTWNKEPIASSQTRCDAIDKSTPFCKDNTGECVATPSTGCVKASELCPSEGVFPYLSNCRQFVYCDTAKVAEVTNCVSNWIYNHTYGDCVPLKSSRDCFQLNCATASNKNRWFAYTPNPKIYFYCSSTEGPMTFQCTGENQAFNQQTRRCEFACPKEGKFAYPGDETNYYSCQLDRGVMKATVLSCPQDLVYDAVSTKCIKKVSGGGGTSG